MNAIQNTLKRLEVGRQLTFSGLTVFPLTGLPAGPAGFTVLDDALAEGTVRIAEVSSAGSVSEVALHNDGDQPVLLIDGEEIAGAKQNRIVNLTLLAPPKEKTIIPVSCVEAGRWASESTEFRSTRQVMVSGARMRKYADVSRAMATEGSRRSNQGKVWEDVSKLSRAYNVDSPTSKMTDVFDQRRGDVEDFVKALPFCEGQVGAVFALAGKIRCVEFFDCAETLTKLWGKLVRSWALDAMLVPKRAFEVQSREEVEKFLNEVAVAGTSRFDGVGLGTDVRFDQDPRLSGGALVLGDQVIQLCVFRSGGNGGDGGGERRRVRGGMARASRRRG